MNQDAWPVPEAQNTASPTDFEKALYQSQLQEAINRHQDERAQAAADLANHRTLLQSIYTAYIDEGKAQLDRAHSSAQFVQTAATAAGTIYTGILGLTFSNQQGGRSLPLAGVVPGLFLALAIVFATAYLAYVRVVQPPAPIALPGTYTGDQIAYRDAFMTWSANIVIKRVWWLHAAVVALAVGIALFPLPYLTVPFLLAAIATAAGVILVITIPTIVRAQNPDNAAL